ncbi:hypothetical protein BC834DRAFT_808164, partial [Gloeopeniophorella convolvens]
LHRGDIPYESPLLRSPSPNDSLTTAYNQDDTNGSDLELSDDTFSTKVITNLRIHEKHEEEERAEARPLLMPRPRRGTGSSVDEKTFEQVMRSLRWHVEQVEEQEMIEASLRHRSRPMLEEHQPSATDLNAIMESMM